MPVPDPRAGKAFIWLISCFLFLVIIAGGGCLLLYVILPPSQSTSWLPVLGVALVCLPWFFWCLTCFYRIISRACGFRVVIGGGGGGGDGGGDGGGGGVGNAVPEGVPAECPEVVVVAEDDQEGVNGGKPKSSRSSSSNSVNSHESEMPLALSMAS